MEDIKKSTSALLDSSANTDRNWMAIPGFPKYSVSDKGDVKNVETGRILKKGVDAFGYEHVILGDENGKRYVKLVHRLVGECFLPNPGRRRTIDHIDGDKRNNDAANLRWATYSENIRYYNEKNTDKVKPKKLEVLQYALDGALIAVHKNSVEAERSTGVKSFSIFRCCKGNLKTAGGYQWRFAPENPDADIPRNIGGYEDRRRKCGMAYVIKRTSRDGSDAVTYERVGDAVKEISELTGATQYNALQNISACLNGRTKTAYGFNWEKVGIGGPAKN